MQFVCKIYRRDIDRLGPVRCVSGLLAALDEDFIWLKGIDDRAGTDAKIKQLPVQQTYRFDESGNLFLPGTITPVARLKEMQWQTLTEFIPAEAPVSAMPALIDEHLPLKLIPSLQTKEADAIMVSLDNWKQYAETAAAIRLQSLRFAVSAEKEVMVIGKPLPALPGREFWQHGNMFLPAGYTVEFLVSLFFLQEQLSAASNAFILFDEQGQWQLIPFEFFVDAKRSAVRLTTG